VLLQTFLVGHRVCKAQLVHDYLQLFFEDGTALNVFNRFDLVDAPTPGLMQLEGAEASCIMANEPAIEIQFATGARLCIDLEDGSWTGTEALECEATKGAILVWG
jgi:hypothetical protein